MTPANAEMTEFLRPADERYPVLPTYLVLDRSSSMAGEPIAALNAEVARLVAAIGRQPMVGEVARLGVIAFADGAEVVLPLSDLDGVAVPALAAGGSTNYEAAFRVLRAQLVADRHALGATAWACYRPVVWFCSDGAPNGPAWDNAHAALVDPGFACRPHIVAVGFGGADPAVIAAVGTLRAFVAAPGSNPTEMLGAIGSSILNSVLSTATAAAGGARPTVVVPTPDGCVALDLV